MMNTARKSEQRILVVEDSPLNRRVIEMCLRDSKWQVELQKDGISGLAAARDFDPDLIILDIGLPGMDGWEVLRQLRERADHERVTVLIVTAHADNDCRIKAELAGADGFLTKPFRPADLRSAVEKLVSA